jgi:hypothetical protein
MKKVSYLFFATMIAFSFVFVSCGDDKEPGNGVDELLGYGYSNLTPEGQKEKLQQDALTFLSELEGIKDEAGLGVLYAFNKFLEISEPGNLNLDSSEDLLYEDLYGKYTWNASKGKWDYTELSNQVEFIFPLDESTEGKIVAIASSPVTIEIEKGENEEKGESVRIPRNVTVIIYANSTEIGSINASSDINTSGTIPSNTTLSYKLGQYGLSFQATKGGTNVITGSFTKGNTVLIDARIDASGNMDNLIAGEDPGNINGNVVIKVNNALAFAGKADVLKYLQAQGQAEAEYEATMQASYNLEAYKKLAQDEAKAFNDFVELYLISLSDKTKIARLKAEVVEHDDDYYSWWESVTVLEFGDGTTQEVEAYFGDGFETFIEKLNEFAENFGF